MKARKEYQKNLLGRPTELQSMMLTGQNQITINQE